MNSLLKWKADWWLPRSKGGVQKGVTVEWVQGFVCSEEDVFKKELVVAYIVKVLDVTELFTIK